ncbi:MAG: glycosyltransferase family 2 protein [Nanoarchaeota archaeon]|nr:glycosyltransferase family 2 protein [Nanoarchaeota archaeon]
MKREKVTLCIPCYQEEKTIAELIERGKPYCNHVLVVASKKSKDRTAEIAAKSGAEVIYDHGKGKGEALRCGISHVKEGIIVFMDADGSHIPEDIPKLVEPIQEGKSDLVIASRMRGGSEEMYGTVGPIFRLFAGALITLIINLRFGTNLSESQNGFRALRVDMAKKLNLQANIFDIETEILMKALKKKYKVSDTPSRELERRHGESGINVITMGWVWGWRILKNWF